MSKVVRYYKNKNWIVSCCVGKTVHQANLARIEVCPHSCASNILIEEEFSTTIESEAMAMFYLFMKQAGGKC